MVQGTIIKGIAGFYYVEAEQRIYECKARGKFRKENIIPLIGDNVLITLSEEENSSDRYPIATIEEILQRKNSLIRPPVANVDQAIVVFSVTYPVIHLDLLERFLLTIEKENITPYIVLNKIDEGNESEYSYIVERYSKIGYKVMALSAKMKINIELLKPHLKDKTTVFAGPSGVGKSTLLNALEKNLSLETGVVSEKIKRGKHTTRHVELMPLSMGGFVLDTPGFTSLQLDGITKEDLKQYFPEFVPLEGSCKFSGCTHVHEPGCKIRKAVETGEIFKERYDSYVTYYNQLKETRRW
ncbi:ribosome small subunit-dependent GTPase A [Sporanaerobium hydrogeniformans]|uniref:ribosome small subunit-dependent GTPase A n=1 Tax=Sporanaerobium hydrogeniformans TaxID=3072179 RepID=UPI0026BA0209|nr:ribosome small subunit-dependent GTPase A [Sporanaerobium hydrogeniformans]